MLISATTLDLEVWRTLPDSASFREDWRRLLGFAAHVTPFHTQEWIKANLSAFGEDGFRILVFRTESGELAGVLPLALRDGRRYLRRRRWMELGGLPHADYGGVSVRRGFETAVARGLTSYLASVGGSWDGAYLGNLLADETFVTSLRSLAIEQKLWVQVRPSQQLRLLAKHEHDARRATGEDRSRSLSKAKRALSKQGELRFDVYGEAGEINAYLNTFFRLHLERFQSKGMHSPLATTRHQNLYRSIVREMAPSGYVWLSILRCGDVPAAMRLSLLYGETLHLYSTCFALEFARHSPAMLQLEFLLDYAFEHGISTVDFGIGDSPHKEKMGATLRRSLVDVELYAKSGEWFESQCFHLAQRVRRASPLVERIGKSLRNWLPYDV